MMKPDRFTEQAKEIIAASQELVLQYHHNQWDVEHVFLALLLKEDGIAVDILKKLGVDIELIKERVEQVLQRNPKVAQVGQIFPTPRIDMMYRIASSEADRLKDEFVSTEHLLIAIAGEQNGEAAKILQEFGVDREKVWQALKPVRGGQRVTDPRAESKYRALEKYSRDLTMLAREGKLDPVIGRDEEIRRVMQILTRRT